MTCGSGHEKTTKHQHSGTVLRCYTSLPDHWGEKKKSTNQRLRISKQRTYCFGVQLVPSLGQNFIHAGLVDESDESESSADIGGGGSRR